MGQLQGRRLSDGDHDYDSVQPGDYWKPGYAHRQPNEWWFRDPFGVIGRIAKHTVVEHEDGTITVSPSILRTGGDGPSFHGWLKAGVWTW